ncbi:MAG: dihydroorotate dehydrogenase [Candidatus Aenigmarchaeota archaeon]|nr:dihydroorotate dehydrogenase [Candidatus Aenigmarchaeota archaeon]
MNLETNLCGIKLKNPTILASGILGVSKSLLKNVIENGAGAVTIKSISYEPRDGHKNPTILEFDSGMINAVGYSNPGLHGALDEFTDLKDLNAPVFASVIGKEPEDFTKVIEGLGNLDFSAIEIPLSCPHTPGFGTLAGQDSPEKTLEITKAVVKAAKVPVFVKLSPNTKNIGEVAMAAEKGGASGITAVNTLGPGMIINIEAAKPVMGFKIGGLSGPAIKPIAVRCVYDVYGSVKIPIIGVGGITTGKDAIEMVMAGATAIGIGSGVNYRGNDVFTKICNEMKDWIEKNNYNSLEEIRGIVHE